MEEEVVNELIDNFYLVATIQGRLAYLLMSIHAVNPSIFARLSDYDPKHILFSNMIYGMAVHLFSRHSMMSLGLIPRLSFSILGSMMFNYSSMTMYEWLVERLDHRPCLRTFLGFFSGRVMMVHLLAYLYHVDMSSVPAVVLHNLSAPHVQRFWKFTTNAQTEEELLNQCRDNFYLAATIQGRLAYLLMSIHAVNPAIFASISSFNPKPILWGNMMYGMSVHLFARPAMTRIGFLHRLSFSVLGSMMFNYSSMMVYEWLVERLEDRRWLLTFLGFFAGRVMLVHLMAYLYHVDTRNMDVGGGIRRDSAYETMYD